MADDTTRRFILITVDFPADTDGDNGDELADALSAYLADFACPNWTHSKQIVSLDADTAFPGDVIAPEDTTEHDAMVKALAACARAAEGDSNDAEITALQDALDSALSRWPGVDAAARALIDAEGE